MAMAKSTLWWIGDWLNEGEQQYGEMYAQALDATELEYGTLRTAKWICGRIELSRRRDNLSRVPGMTHMPTKGGDKEEAHRGRTEGQRQQGKGTSRDGVSEGSMRQNPCT